MKKLFTAVLAAALLISATACSGNSSSSSSQEAEKKALTDGTYTARAQGNSSEITVQVTVEGGAITAIEMDGADTDHIQYQVKETLPARIIDAQSVAVDSVSGATITSFAVKTAVKDCIMQAGGDDTWTKASETSKTEQSRDVKVLVIGAGMSGLTAGNYLVENGVEVLMVEQLDMTGGTARYAEGRLFGSLADNDEERVTSKFTKQSTSAPTDYDKTLYPNAEKVSGYASKVHEIFRDWEEYLGYTLEYYDDGNEIKVQINNDNAAAEYTKKKGAQLTDTLTASFTANGGELLKGTKAVSLITDSNGNVTGAVCENDEGTLTVNAEYVIVATGSAGANTAMQAEYRPEKADGETRIISVGSDGSGMKMILEVGGVMLSDWINSTSYLTTTPELARTNLAFQSKVANNAELYVNRNGERLGNEANSFNTLNYYESGVVDCLYVICDSDNAASLEFTEALEKGLESQPDYYFKADTIEELAALCGFDAETFSNTVRTYNSYCERGEDKDFAKPAEKLVAVKNGPFYAVKEMLVNRDISGGVVTDVTAHVLDDEGNVIEGVYAVGFAAARDYYGNSIPGASSLGVSAVTGRIAAEDIISLVNG